ncbi:hypothetical protein [Streptomyces sp. MH60]|uniref:hypothetical protein n=1 Tax=Streptomyces sp. MH60 TaxID=1940758 RepID=UPI000D459ECD|nr:hypothetical protein [Streptomyces sp. MH60]PPS89518.1 hypothetical protein BZZ08_01664 [Streptomyces sp. MH60]
MDRSDRNLLIKIVALASCAAAVIAVVAFGIKWATADLRGAADAREKTVANGDFRIGTYEQFFDLCSSVQSAEAAIKNAETELATKPPADRAEKLQQVITAQRNVRADSITTYNSKAAQNHRQAFQDTDLPYTLDLNTQETQCAAA